MKIIIYTRQPLGQNRTDDLRRVVQSHGNLVVATFSDDPAISGKNKFAGWRALVARLDDADQIVVGSVGDLPGRKVLDLLKILAMLRERGVTLRLNQEAIDTGAGTAATLDLIATYRRAALSQAIIAGQKKARRNGKILGRPPVPDPIRLRIADALANGIGIRLAARRFNVSPGTVVNIRTMMSGNQAKSVA